MMRKLARSNFKLLVFSQLLLMLIAFLEYLWQNQVFHHPFHEEILKNLVILAAFALCIVLNIVASSSIFNLYQKEALLDTRSAMSESFASLAASINAQNFKFSQQIRTLNNLVQGGRFDELKVILENTAGKITVLNSVLKIDNPIIGALLKAKTTEADIGHINLQIDITTPLSGLGQRSLDIVRILGNLIDNAFDAVPQEDLERSVSVRIYREGPLFRMEVGNQGEPLPAGAQADIFKPGYTTKGAEHSGMGLHIVKTLAEKMSGTVKIVEEIQGIRFVVTLPGV